MWVVPLFFKLSCFAWKLHSRTGVLTESRSDGCMLMGEISKRRQHTISSVRLGIEISKIRRHKLTLVLRYNHQQTLCPRPFWPLRNFLKSFCDKTVRPCEPVSVNCPSEPEKLHCLDIIQTNEDIDATKLQPLTKDSMEQQRSADGEQGGL